MCQMSTDDLERAKQWGWQIAYQGVLAEFGLAGLRQAYPDSVFFDVVFIAGIFGVMSVARLEVDAPFEAIVLQPAHYRPHQNLA